MFSGTAQSPGKIIKSITVAAIVHMQYSLELQNKISNWSVKEQGGEQGKGSLIKERELKTSAGADTTIEDKGDQEVESL